MNARRVILGINYVVLALSCGCGSNWVKAGIMSGMVIKLFSGILSLVLIYFAIIVHRSFPEKHDKASEFAELMTSGPYSYVRHPLYSILIALNYTVSLVFLSIYAIIASTLLLPLWWYLAKTEEDDLVRLWGQKYMEYRKEVPMLLPRYPRNKKGEQEEPSQNCLRV
jgi:protein-S-isoprenylcysteine O-methyltransferase Ste14